MIQWYPHDFRQPVVRAELEGHCRGTRGTQAAKPLLVDD